MPLPDKRPSNHAKLRGMYYPQLRRRCHESNNDRQRMFPVRCRKKRKRKVLIVHEEDRSWNIKCWQRVSLWLDAELVQDVH